MAGTFSSNSHIQEAVPFHFIARVNIPEINQKGTSHTLLDQIEIERPKSTIGDNHHASAPIGTRVWSITIDYIWKNCFCMLHPNGIKGAPQGAPQSGQLPPAPGPAIVIQ